MKKVKNILIAALIITGTSMSFTACKKGEGDPFLSLRTRKARVCGEWKLSKIEGTRSYVFASNTITETVTYDGTTETTVTTPGNFTSTDKYTVEYTFEKDGTFKLVFTDNNGSSPNVNTLTGVWNFTGGVGDFKNKSQIILYTESESDGTSTVNYTGSDRPQMLFDLYQLKNKEIILEEKGTQSNNSENVSKKYTLTAK